MASSKRQPKRGSYTYNWDAYVERWHEWSGRGTLSWPGDEWGAPEYWDYLYDLLFVPAGVASWQRAVEIGQGSGKYALKVLESSAAEVRCYDVSPRFLEVCEARCKDQLEQGRLTLRLLDGADADEMRADLTGFGWKRKVDAVYSIDAMVHVDLELLVGYLITAALVLKPGGKVILTLANAGGRTAFEKLLADIPEAYREQGRFTGRFEWLSRQTVETIFPRLGFEFDLLSDEDRDIYVVASLARPEAGEELQRYLRDTNRGEPVAERVAPDVEPAARSGAD
jgi:SAM-dependent methyltransferase